jgi:membrane protein YqaA with SNARE-associated domain
MLRQLYNWTMSFAAHRNARKALAGISFAESSFFPIPPDVLLIPMVLAERRKAFEIAAICTIASVIGGMLGYAIGAFLYDTVGQWVVNLYNLQDKMEAFKAQYEEWGLLIILLAGFTPIPYKVFTITSGLLAYDFGLFVLLSAVGRGGRFFLLATLLYYFGEPIKGFIERRLEVLTAGVAALAVAGFVLVRYGL